MTELNADLRRCRLPVDLDESQNRLYALVLEIDERRAEISREV